MLVNFSNHPSSVWPEDEMAAAREQYGQVKDYKFPNVDPKADTDEIRTMAKQCVSGIMDILEENKEDPKGYAVLCQGEFTLAYAVSSALLRKTIKRRPVKVVAATTERKTVEQIEDGVIKKTSEFRFVQFREYPGEKIVEKGKMYEGKKSSDGQTDKILIACLGAGNYRTAEYGLITEDTPSDFFNTRYTFDAITGAEKPNKLLLIGTSGSSWLPLLEWYERSEAAPDADAGIVRQLRQWEDKEIKQRLESAGKEDLIAAMEKYICAKGNFERVKIVIVPFGTTSEELEEYFQILKDALYSLIEEARKTKVVFDISYGFRSMPLFIMMLVQYMALLKQASISYSVYYGMFETDVLKADKTKCKPLVDLSRVTEMTDWVNAISEFLNQGSVRKLYDCLEREKETPRDISAKDQAEKLMAVLERLEYGTNSGNMYYLTESIHKLTDLKEEDYNSLSNPARELLGVVSEIFRERFRKYFRSTRGSWPYGYYSYFQMKLADMYLEQGKYGPASTMLTEGVDTYLLEHYDNLGMSYLSLVRKYFGEEDYIRWLFNYDFRSSEGLGKVIKAIYAGTEDEKTGAQEFLKKWERSSEAAEKFLKEANGIAAKGKAITGIKSAWSAFTNEVRQYFPTEEALSIDTAQEEGRKYGLEYMINILKEQVRNVSAHGLFKSFDSTISLRDVHTWIKVCINSLLYDMEQGMDTENKDYKEDIERVPFMLPLHFQKMLSEQNSGK